MREGIILIGARLKQSRLATGLTQTELGRLVGVGKSAISQYENGARTPDLAVLERLARAFGVSCDWLLGLENQHLGVREARADYTTAGDATLSAYLAELAAQASSIQAEADRYALLAMARFLAHKKTREAKP